MYYLSILRRVKFLLPPPPNFSSPFLTGSSIYILSIKNETFVDWASEAMIFLPNFCKHLSQNRPVWSSLF
jgi:hypothetical protein